MWGYNSKPLHECTGHLNGHRFGVFIRCRFKRIRCIHWIKVKLDVISGEDAVSAVTETGI